MLIKKIGEYPRFELLQAQVLALKKNIKRNQIALQWRDEYDKTYGNSSCMDHVYNEEQFINIIPDLQGTEIDKLLNFFSFRTFRARIMTLATNISYIPHIDSRPRIHIPIISNPKCRFVFFNPERQEEEYMPADGGIYWIDVRTRHTFENKSDQSRIHIVMVTDYVCE